MTPEERKEHNRQRARQHYLANKQKYIDRAKDWGIKNRKKLNEIRKNYRHKNPQYSLTYYHKNKEKINARNRAIQKLPHNRAKAKLNARGKMLKRFYKITEEQYNEMSTKQHHKCAICNQPETSFDSRLKVIKKLAVDHCHKTKKNRALLCCRCNLSLGRFEDSIQLLQSAIEYLKKHSV